MLVRADVAMEVWRRLRCETEGMFERLMLCGSLRRGQPRVHDVDVVGIPVFKLRKRDMLDDKPRRFVPFFEWLMENADPQAPAWVKPTQKWAPKNPVSIWDTGRRSVRFFLDGVQVDAYLASERRFWPLVVIRTGPARQPGTYGPDDPGALQNIVLAQRAKRMGLSLTHEGIKAHGKLVGFESEEAFFRALHLPYCPPEYRDSPLWIALIRSRPPSSPPPEGTCWRPGEQL